jgi:hypothetical protein
MTLDGMFVGCQLLKCRNKASFPQYIICSTATNYRVVQQGESLKKMVKYVFEGRENVSTQKINSMRYENPFMQILLGKPGPHTFSHAEECLNDDDFKSLWMNARIVISKKPYSLTKLGGIFYGKATPKTQRDRVHKLFKNHPEVFAQRVGTWWRVDLAALRKMGLVSEEQLRAL